MLNGFRTDNTNTKKLVRPRPRTDYAIAKNRYGHGRTGRTYASGPAWCDSEVALLATIAWWF